MRRLFIAGIVAFSAIFFNLAHAQVGVLAIPDPQPGKEYTVLPNPIPTSDPSKIEVTEVFWYGCPHCYHLEPVINKWAKDLPDDVNFVRMPALFGNYWTIHGQLFITLNTLGAEEKLHTAVFESIQKRQNLLLTPEDMAEFVSQHGIDKQKFLDTYNSFGVKSQLEKDKKTLAQYGISGVPAIIVNGKYRIDLNEYVTEPTELMNVTNYLIKKERAAQTQTSETATK